MRSMGYDIIFVIGETFFDHPLSGPAILKKLLEKSGEAYHEWNSSLPGHVPPHEEIAEPFETADDLRAAFHRAIEIRERLRAEMIARQEEMDWLVYEAYGLIEKAPVLTGEADLSLAREERPFCRGFDFKRCLVCFHFTEDVAGLDRIARMLFPAHDDA